MMVEMWSRRAEEIGGEMDFGSVGGIGVMRC